MHLAIIHNDANITGITTSKRTLLHTSHDSFKNSWHKASINGTTDYRIEEYKLASPFQINHLFSLDIHTKFLPAKLKYSWVRHTFSVRFYDKMHLTKLTSTTRLLLMTIIGTRSLGNSLTIRNLRFTITYLNLLIVLHTPFQCTKMEFTLAMHNSLAQFLRLLYYPCRIFLTHLDKSSHHLFCLSLIRSLDSTGILRVWILDEIISVFIVLRIKGITSFHVFQFHGATDIACLQFIHRYAVGSCACIESSYTLFRAAVSIGKISTGLNFSTHHLEITYFTDMWFHTCLKEI